MKDGWLQIARGEVASLRQFALFKLLLVLALVLGARVLVLLVLGDEVVHVGLGLGELHLVHALARVPVQESLAAEHGRELLRDALEQLLDGRAVADERGGHLETARRDVADGRLHVVRDPLDEVAAVLVLHVQHLLVHLSQTPRQSLHAQHSIATDRSLSVEH